MADFASLHPPYGSMDFWAGNRRADRARRAKSAVNYRAESQPLCLYTAVSNSTKPGYDAQSWKGSSCVAQ